MAEKTMGAWLARLARRRPLRLAGVAGLLAAALWMAHRRVRLWYAAYNAQALAFFRRGLSDESATAALDEQLREAARLAVAAIPAAKARAFPAEIDVTLSGGGFKTSYAGGVALALEALRKAHPGHGAVVRWSGASAGAMMGLASVVGAFSPMLVWAMTVIDTLRKFPLAHPYPFWLGFWPALAKSHPIPKPGQLNISLTRVKRVFPFPRLENWVVSEFPTQNDLGDALMATGCIPWVLHDTWWRWYRGHRVIDGGFTVNTPLFWPGSAEDGERQHQDDLTVSLQQRPQLVVRFLQLPGATQDKIIYYTHEEVIALVHRGIADLVQLVSTGGRHDAGGNLELLDLGQATQRAEQSFGSKVRARLRASFAFKKAGEQHHTKQAGFAAAVEPEQRVASQQPSPLRSEVSSWRADT